MPTKSKQGVDFDPQIIFIKHTPDRHSKFLIKCNEMDSNMHNFKKMHSIQCHATAFNIKV